MIIDNNQTYNKSKALFGAIGMLLFSVLMAIWPRPTSYSQPEQAAIKPIYQTKDSLAILRQRNDRQDSINLVEARSLTQLTKGLNRKLRKRADIHVEAVKLTVVLRWKGDVYETDPESYKNYLIVDVDSFLSEVDTVSNQQPNEFIDTVFPEPKPTVKRSWIQKIFKK